MPKAKVVTLTSCHENSLSSPLVESIFLASSSSNTEYYFKLLFKYLTAFKFSFVPCTSKTNRKSIAFENTISVVSTPDVQLTTSQP